MAKRVAPTRGNLVKMQRAVIQAQNGHDLLEQKRQVLMMELVKYMDAAKTLQQDVARVFAEAYAALQRANISIGIDTVEDIAASVPRSADIVIRLHSVMGVELPETDEVSAEIAPSYSLHSSTGAMDDAYRSFRHVYKMLLRLAEIETSVYRLAVQIRKTHRRVNALEKVVIPANMAEIAFISDVLEESDREDFSRMKAAKHMREMREAEPNPEISR